VRKGYTEGCAIAKAEYPDCNKRFITENQPNGPKVHWAGFIIDSNYDLSNCLREIISLPLGEGGRRSLTDEVRKIRLNRTRPHPPLRGPPSPRGRLINIPTTTGVTASKKHIDIGAKMVYNENTVKIFKEYENG
jgi:hypothetical protein